MGSVTKKPSPVVIIKKKRRILSHQDDAVQAVPDDIKQAPVMEFKTDSLNTSHQWPVPRNNRKKQDVRRKKEEQ
ncbi:RNA chaperone ProQ (fragment) (plasmid) [Escherichia coli]